MERPGGGGQPVVFHWKLVGCFLCGKNIDGHYIRRGGSGYERLSLFALPWPVIKECAVGSDKGVITRKYRS